MGCRHKHGLFPKRDRVSHEGTSGGSRKAARLRGGKAANKRNDSQHLSARTGSLTTQACQCQDGGWEYIFGSTSEPAPVLELFGFGTTGCRCTIRERSAGAVGADVGETFKKHAASGDVLSVLLVHAVTVVTVDCKESIHLT